MARRVAKAFGIIDFDTFLATNSVSEILEWNEFLNGEVEESAAGETLSRIMASDMSQSPNRVITDQDEKIDFLRSISGSPTNADNAEKK